METIWDAGDSASVRAVFDCLKTKKKICYTTVMTIMTRLCEKNMLRRAMGEDGAYIYSAAQSKKDFLRSVFKRTVGALVGQFGELAVAQFIDAVESSNLKNLKEWREKLKKILK